MYEILGWYTVGTAVTELDLGIQRQVRRAHTGRTIMITFRLLLGVECRVSVVWVYLV